MDIFSRIAAAIALMAAGVKKDSEELLGHIGAIDEHLADNDTHNEAVDENLVNNADENEENAHVDVVHAGLQKIIDASRSPAGTEDVNSEAGPVEAGNAIPSGAPASLVGENTADAAATPAA